MASDKLDKFLKGNSSPKIISRGKQILDNKGVTIEKVSTDGNGEGIFKVKNETTAQQYNVEIKNWNSGIIITKCTCDYDWGGICEHRVSSILSLKEYLKINPKIEAFKPKFVTAEQIVRISAFDDFSLKQLATEADWKFRNALVQTDIKHALNGVVEAEVKHGNATYLVRIEKLRYNNEFLTTCNCNLSIEAPLCIHKLSSLIAIRNAYGPVNPFERMRDYSEEKKKLLAEYGFTIEEDISGKFDFKIATSGELQLIVLDKSIQKLSEYQNWRVINNTIFRPADASYLLNSIESDADSKRQLIYVIHFEGEQYLNDLNLDVLSAKVGKQGKISLIKPLETSNFKDFPEMTESDSKLIALINSISGEGIQSYAKKKDLRLPYFTDRLNREDVSADTLPIIEEYINKQLDRIIQILQSKLLFNSKTSYVSNQGDLTPIEISPEKVLPHFCLREEEDFIVLEGFCKLGNKQLKLGTLINPPSFWLRSIGTQVYKLANPEVANLLHYLPKNGILKVKKSNFAGFFQDFILPLSEKFTVDLQIEHPIVQQKLFFKETSVYLKEDDSNLLFVPTYTYTEKEIPLVEEAPLVEEVVEVVKKKPGRKPKALPIDLTPPEGQSFEFRHDHKANRILFENDQITIHQRSEEAERDGYRILNQLHPNFVYQEQYPFLYLSFEEVLKNGWLFTFVDTMQHQNIKVLGMKELKKFKYNTNRANINIRAASGIDWFDMKIEFHFGDQMVSLKDIQKTVLKKQNYVELKDGTLGMLPEEWIKKYENILKFGKIKGEELQVSKLHFSLIDELSEDLDNIELEKELFEKKQKLLNFKEMPNVALPHNVNATLRDYQLEGFKWLCFLDEFGWGGVLADDMGLGKTLQMLTFLQEQQNRHPEATNLVVLPTTLIFNWQAEVAKFCPDLKVFVHRGGTRQKTNGHWKEYDIILTTYGMIRSDIELFKEFMFNYIILDESQAIKNPDSLISKAVKLLKARNRLVMTGTPVENNTFDLFSQMDFINPGLLGTQEFFKSEFANPIDKGQDKETASQLRKIVYPFMLKRTKEEVAKDLPEKTESIIFCEMDKKQRKVYDTFREMYRQKLVDKMAVDGKEKSSFLILEGLLKLRQICDSPALLNDDAEYDDNSAKLDEIIREIEENAGNHKILIFSQFLKMLDLIKTHLEKHKIPFEYLDGKTSDRASRVNHFQEDDNCRVFLMSLKAGGVGINLTEADYVYLVDPWWNPAVEQQAIDRTHRIGQKKNVFAYRMICKDTIEEKILMLQAKKRDLARDLISTEDGFLKKLTQEDIIDLFT